MVTVSASHSAARSAATAATAAAGPPAPASSPARAARPARSPPRSSRRSSASDPTARRTARAQRGGVAREVGQRQRRRVAQRPRGHEREQPALGRRLAVRERCGRHVGDRMGASRAERGVGHRHLDTSLAPTAADDLGMALPIDEARAKVLAAVRPLRIRGRRGPGRARPRAGRGCRRRPRRALVRQQRDGRLRRALRARPGARCASSASRAPGRPPTSASATARRCGSRPARRCPRAPTPSCRSSSSTVDGDTVTLDDEVDARPQPAPRGRRHQRRRDRPARRHPHRRGRDRHRGRGRPRNRVAAPAARASSCWRPATSSSPPGGPLGPGPAAQLQRRDARGAGRRRPARACCAPTRSGDTEEATRAAIAAALEEADVLVLSGGVSVGPHDHVKPALEALGVDEVFWRVALRPGTPDLVRHARRRARLRPARQPGLGDGHLHALRPPGARGDAGRPARARADRAPPRRRHPAPPRPRRVRPRDPRTTASRRRPAPQGSHQLSSMLGADGFAIVTAGEGSALPGDQVVVELV